jgi:UTP-glucose-1-phosphate uridylyltransferase
VPVTEANAARLSASGRVEIEPDGDQRFRITRLLAKERGARLVAGRDRFKMTGRYVFPGGWLAEFDQDRGESEHDDTPTLMRWAREGRLAGVVTPGDLFDCGNPEGYRAAWRRLIDSGSDTGPRAQ